jgi:hypothetical protein
MRSTPDGANLKLLLTKQAVAHVTDLGFAFRGNELTDTNLETIGNIIGNEYYLVEKLSLDVTYQWYLSSSNLTGAGVAKMFNLLYVCLDVCTLVCVLFRSRVHVQGMRYAANGGSLCDMRDGQGLPFGTELALSVDRSTCTATQLRENRTCETCAQRTDRHNKRMLRAVLCSCDRATVTWVQTHARTLCRYSAHSISDLWVDISGNGISDPASMAHIGQQLGQWRALTALNFTNQNPTLGPNVRQLSQVGNTGFVGFMQGLFQRGLVSALTNLTINFAGNQITDQGLIASAEFFGSNLSSVTMMTTVLDYQVTPISPAGVVASLKGLGAWQEQTVRECGSTCVRAGLRAILRASLRACVGVLVYLCVCVCLRSRGLANVFVRVRWCVCVIAPPRCCDEPESIVALVATARATCGTSASSARPRAKSTPPSPTAPSRRRRSWRPARHSRSSRTHCRAPPTRTSSAPACASPSWPPPTTLRRSALRWLWPPARP